MFQELMATYIEAAPSKEAINVFAEKYPDRYAQALSILRKAAGYKEDQAPTNQYNILIQNMAEMSDSELLQQIEHIEANTIEGQVLKSQSHIEDHTIKSNQTELENQSDESETQK